MTRECPIATDYCTLFSAANANWKGAEWTEGNGTVHSRVCADFRLADMRMASGTLLVPMMDGGGLEDVDNTS